MIVQNIIWCVVGVFGGLVIAKLGKKRPRQSSCPQQPQPPVGGEPINRTVTEQVIEVTPHPNGPAKDAFVANVKNLSHLFEALNKGEKFSEAVNTAIIEINNKELMNIWVKISKDPKAIMRILASWGIRREDEVQFQPQKHHFERYTLHDGNSIIEGKNYQVVSQCWIYTFTDKDGATQKDVVFKGVAKEV